MLIRETGRRKITCTLFSFVQFKRFFFSERRYLQTFLAAIIIFHIFTHTKHIVQSATSLSQIYFLPLPIFVRLSLGVTLITSNFHLSTVFTLGSKKGLFFTSFYNESDFSTKIRASSP